jgi:hypothetical protein
MDSAAGTPSLGWVAPFGDPRIEACSRLPGAFRSVPRPSSPLDAKASTRCPSLARPAPAAAPPGRRVAYPCQRVPDAPEGAAGTRQSARPRPGTRRDPGRRPASTTPPHDVKRDKGAADAAPDGTARPRRAGGPEARRPPTTPLGVVGPGRLERPTSRLSGVRSDRLSYGPAPGAPEKGRRGGLGEGTGGRRGRPFDAPRGQGPARGP